MDTSVLTTRIDLAEDIRREMVDLINQQLADTFDLYSQTKQAHWNVKGMQFQQLHELFDLLAGELTAHVDTIAERATALGGSAQGTVRAAAASSTLSEFRTGPVGGREAVEALANGFGRLASTTRHAIDQAAECGDATTADMFTEVSRALDKHLWFLEAHLQG